MVEVAAQTRPAHGRLRLLDGLRLVAAISVLLFHFTSRASAAWGMPPWRVFPWLSAITGYGALGVQLFFMISGFVVLMSAWGRTSSAFVASRVGRLYPAYWFAVLVTGTMLFLARPPLPDVRWEQVGAKGVLVNLTMVQQPFRIPHVDGVYWTLWEEAKFYLVVLILTAVGITARRVFWTAVIWPVLAVLQLIVQVPVVGAFLNVNTAAYFSVGMLLYLGYREGYAARIVVALVFAMGLVLVSIVTFVVPLFDRYVHVPLQPLVVLALCCVMVAAIILATTTRLAAVNWAWLSTAGALTYPLYLLHDDWGLWLIGLLHPLVDPPVLVVALLLLFCLVAYLVNQFVERPLGPVLRRGLERLLSPLETRLRSGSRAPRRAPLH